ncbi:histone deacetylase [Glaciecola sp. MH2013]|uniref:histone deacetylase family protein n=1 Tax=Glaciecola sp. MH2013 TaxID=2785524 RepID=UPI00189D91BB|nr:histone deacetylase [Glaciecola sp. MH2013]MBF7074888.1 histone deacetylase [Glaciecola sp. MH2013]
MPPLVFHPIYSQLDLPVRHRFPIEKYVGIHDALVGLGVSEAHFRRPDALKPSTISSIYDPNYIGQLCSGELSPKAMRRIGFPWSQQLVERTLTAAGGTVLTSSLALEHGKALNLTGGYHHAFANFGSGFCMINDLYLAALNMLQAKNIDRVLIFDCDVHQGDGTAKLAENNEAIYTVSIHGEKNFPYRKQASNLDFGLAKATEDDEFLSTVEQAWHMAMTYFQPDAVIYDAGVDIHVDDDLGHLHISTDGVLQRDRFVFEQCEKLGIPVAAVIGGGYQRDIDALVKVHLQLFKAAGAYT